MSFSNKGFSLYLTLMLETVDTVIFFLFCVLWGFLFVAKIKHTGAEARVQILALIT